MTLAVPVGGAFWLGFYKIFQKFDKIFQKLDGLENTIDGNHMELLAALSCLPRAFGSVATGLREAAAGGPVLAFVAASRADVAAWLKEVGFEQYEEILAPLGGAGLLLQTPASLVRLGVLPGHVPLLLSDIDKARALPADDAHDAR